MLHCEITKSVISKIASIIVCVCVCLLHTYIVGVQVTYGYCDL